MSESPAPTASPAIAGMHSTRGSDGFGITVGYWADEASAVDWRATSPEHVQASAIL